MVSERRSGKLFFITKNINNCNIKLKHLESLHITITCLFWNAARYCIMYYMFSWSMVALLFFREVSCSGTYWWLDLCWHSSALLLIFSSTKSQLQNQHQHLSPIPQEYIHGHHFDLIIPLSRLLSMFYLTLTPQSHE